MNLKNIGMALLQTPSTLLQNKNIFLISHMRGNTSLLSHLLGSHPSINGYYEMHIGYHSWKSLIRQKMMYLDDHQFKKNSRYFFDKILHNDHDIKDDLLVRKNSKVIFMIREPEQTIKSIVNIYRKKEPLHKYCNIEDAADYYRSRLKQVNILASKTKGDFYFLQSEILKSEPEKVLGDLSEWLELDSPISTTYSQFKNTGKEKFGDSSESIFLGKIHNKETDYSVISLNSKLLQQLNKEYKETYSLLSKNNLVK